MEAAMAPTPTTTTATTRPWRIYNRCRKFASTI